MSDFTNPDAAQPEKRKVGRPPNQKPAPLGPAELEQLARDGIQINDAPTRLKPDEPASGPTPDFGTPEYAEYVARIRDIRKPFGDFTQKLARQHRPGYYRVWINDEPGRIQQARNAGYEHVKDPATGKTEVLNVNPHTPGAAQLGYLMEIPQVIWDLDQKAKHKHADDIESAIRRSQVIASDAGSAKEDAGGFYVPGGGSKVETIGKGRI